MCNLIYVGFGLWQEINGTMCARILRIQTSKQDGKWLNLAIADGISMLAQ
jgi:hypothetical protein